ncbi:MAG: McrC family protein [Candidatus Kapaibacterium sp.]
MRSNVAERRIELVEWERTAVLEERITSEHIRLLRKEFSSVIRVERDPLEDGCWFLTSLGYVGSIPLGDDLLLHLHPKTPVGNIFRMIEHAYRIDFKIFDTLYYCETLPGMVDALALILAERLLHRVRRGLYRAYIPRTARLEALRGRLDVEEFIRSDYQPDLPCTFGEQTVENEENQIICWTLHLLLRSSQLSQRVRPTVRKAWRALSRSVSPFPCSSRICVGRSYNRLNSDYEMLHTICRFFLDTLVPAHRTGEHPSFSFLIDMNLLFERFVAEWLRGRGELHDAGIRITTQERALVGEGAVVTFIFDILVKDHLSGATRCVIDTKYKVPVKPANDDIFQVVAYATQQRCRQAVLIYPEALSNPIDITVGDVRIKSLTFPISGEESEEIEVGGKNFLRELLGLVDD